jgi:acetyl-CoA carboxylase biotin carboxylase subunit
MECRIYAEDPANHFFPSPGEILSWRAPHGPGIRLDEGAYAGWTVPGDYDPLLAKLIAWGAQREETIARLERALKELQVTGIRTNATLFQKILADADFREGAIHTRWLDERLTSFFPTRAADPPSGDEALEKEIAMIAAALWHVTHAQPTNLHAQSVSRWRDDGRLEQISRAPKR